MTTVVPPAVAVIGKSDSGKTTLVERLVTELTRRGHRVGTIKHTSHGFEIDHEGKDSYRLFHAGSRSTLIVSEEKIALVRRTDREVPLPDLLSLFVEEDLVLLEGYKDSDRPKIEVCRPKEEELLCDPASGSLLAIASDTPVGDVDTPRFLRDDVRALADFIEVSVMRGA